MSLQSSFSTIDSLSRCRSRDRKKRPRTIRILERITTTSLPLLVSTTTHRAINELRSLVLVKLAIHDRMAHRADRKEYYYLTKPQLNRFRSASRSPGKFWRESLPLHYSYQYARDKQCKKWTLEYSPSVQHDGTSNFWITFSHTIWFFANNECFHD